ncbi:MAG: hypothetical protein ACE37L_07020 [Allomuricauda sp.]
MMPRNPSYTLTLFLYVLFSIAAFSQQNIHKDIQEHTEMIFDSLVKIRRDFHRHPEVGGEEQRT